MTFDSLPQEALKFQIQAYKKPEDLRLLKETNVCFSGSPRKHPYDSDKVILIADPFSANNLYYEFNNQPQQMFFILGLYVLLTTSSWLYSRHKEHQIRHYSN